MSSNQSDIQFLRHYMNGWRAYARQNQLTHFAHNPYILQSNYKILIKFLTYKIYMDTKLNNKNTSNTENMHNSTDAKQGHW